MEVDIDPLSVLEQFMQVNDNEAASSDMINEDIIDLDGDSTMSESNMKEDRLLELSEQLQSNDTPEEDTANPFLNSALPSIPDFILDSAETQAVIMQISQPQKKPASRSSNKKKPVKKTPPKKATTPSSRSSNRTKSSNFKIVNNIMKLDNVTQSEMAYRNKLFPDLEQIAKQKLDCTICDFHIGCYISLNVNCLTHPLLRVLVCETCKARYVSTDWTLGPNNLDVRCRWCAQLETGSSLLKHCSQCPFAFCQACMVRNFSFTEPNQVLEEDKWVCYVCSMVPLYFSRAVCWALQSYISNLNNRKVKKEAWYLDFSICCALKNEGNTQQVMQIGECSLLQQEEQENTTSTNRRTLSRRNQVNNSRSVEVNSSVNNQGIKLVNGGNSRNTARKGGVNKSVRSTTISVGWPKSRIANMFSSVDSVKSKIVLHFRNEPKSDKEVETCIDGALGFITQVIEQATECKNSLEKWLKCQLNNKVVESSRPAASAPLATILHSPALTIKPVHSPNYTELFQKYQIKPCSVVLQRYVPGKPIPGYDTATEDTSDSFLLSLLEPHVDIVETQSDLVVPGLETSNDVISLDDEEDCYIID